MRKCWALLLCMCICYNSISQTITANPSLTVCAPQSVVLTVNPSGANYQWESAPASGGPYTNIGGATSQSYTATASGWYRVDVGGPSGGTSPAVHVVINAAPTATFTFTPNSQCSNNPVYFDNNSTGSGLSYSWNFNDPNSGSLNTSTAINPSHTFIGTTGNGNQNFNVQLIATNSAGCTDNYNATVTVKQIPDATLTGFTIYNNKRYLRSCSNSASATFNFVNGSTTQGTNTNYQIVWGDGSSDYNSPTFTALTHSYPIGTTNALFIVTGANGCKDTIPYFIFLGTNPAVGLGNPGNTAICTNNSLTFPISNTASNSPGTAYTVTFNDGSPSISYVHPAPADVTHQFLVTSCGTTSSTYQNSFSATIQASNPCASSTASVVPIYVSQKAPPTFQVSPGDTVCVNTTTTITNTTGSNYEIDNGSGVCTEGKWVWSITPATGWSLAGGSFGNTNGFTDPAFWLSGTPSLNINFNATGTFSIKLTTGNTVCGADSITKTICVNPTPLAAFTINQNLGCAPLPVTTVNGANSPLCGQNKYLWSVAYTATTGCSAGVSGFTYTGGTSSSSSAPQFSFTNAGVYTISMYTISPASACTSLVATQTVTVKAKPEVNIPAITSVCGGQNISPVASASCYTGSATYLWTFPGGTPATSANLNPGSVLFNTPGPVNISLAVTNECGTTTATEPVTIKQTPSLTIPSSATFCPGNTVGPLTFASSLGGTTISWSNNNSAIALGLSGTSNPIPAFNVVNNTASPVTGTITVRGTLNGCTATETFTITVNPKPSAPVAGDVNYCKDETAIPLNATATPGNSLLWYTVATGGTGSNTAPTPSTSSTLITTYYVSQLSSSNNCESVRTPVTVTVNAIPVITSATASNPSVCGGSNGSITLTGLTPLVLYTVQYIKNGGAVSVSLNASSAGVVLISGLTAGTYTDIKVTRSSCTSAPVGPFTLSDLHNLLLL